MRAIQAAILGVLATALALPFVSFAQTRDPLLDARAKLSIFRLKSEPRIEATATVGGDLVVAPVAYAATGSLREPISGYSLLGKTKPLPAGTPVFGLPMTEIGSISNPAPLTWCAPLSKPGGKGGAAIQWDVICFPTYIVPRWEELGPSLFPASIPIRVSDSQSPPPEVLRGPIDVDLPLDVVVQFMGWTADGADVRFVVREPGSRSLIGIKSSGDHPIARIHLPRSADGGSHLAFYGGEVLIRPATNPSSAVTALATPFPITPPS